LATGSAVSWPRRTGGGGTRPADAGPATCSCSGGHPTAPAGSVADTSRPDTDLVDTDRGSGSSSGWPRRPRCPVPPSPRHRPRCPAGAGRRRTRSRRFGAAAGPRRLVCSSALVMWSGRRGQRRTAVRLRGHRTRPAEHREPARPALRTPATAAGHGGTVAAATLDSRRQDRPPPGNGVRPERDPKVWHRPPRPADRQIRSLGAAGNLASSWKGGAG
jgi:hypothetical protein